MVERNRLRAGRHSRVLGRAAPSAGAAAELFLVAVAHHQAGRLDEAATAYQRAIALKPDYAEAHNNLGALLRRQGWLEAAAASYRLAIAANPAYAEAHNNLGLLLHHGDRLEEAAASCERAIALRPAYADAHRNLGSVLQALGRPDEAVDSYRRATALNPNDATALANLGVVLSRLGRPEAAAEAFHSAIALNPAQAETHNGLGVVLHRLGRLDEAEVSYRIAIALNPNYALAHCNLGGVLQDSDRLEEAAQCHRRALALQPNYPEALNNLGIVLQDQGHLDEAAACFQRAVELNPDNVEACHNLAGVRLANDAAVARLRRQLGDMDRYDPKERSLLLFALGKALEEQDEFDGAFDCLAEANTLHRAGLSFDIGAAERQMDRIATVFDGARLRRLEGAGAASERPIFIVGMPRSGTTLVEQIVSAHPLAHGAGEIANFSVAAERGPAGDGMAFPDWVERASAEDCRAIGQAYLDSLPAGAPWQTRTTDKLVSNVLRLGLIHLALPDARIIHCQRDPRDTCLSCYSISFRGGPEYVYDLGELGRYWRAYDRLMAHWRAVLPPGRMLEIPYEAVVEDPEVWARRLIEHCGLEWDDACLRFYESKRQVRTASSAQVRRPIYTASMGRWRPFAHRLGPLLDALGEPWSSYVS